MIYGYCRTSTNFQNTEHQKRQILQEYPTAVIYEDKFSGATLDRPEFTKLLKKLKTGDTIVFVSVSRMSRNAEEGFELYQKLFKDGVNLIFLNEHYIDTDTYKKAIQNKFEKTGEKIDYILEGIEKYMIALAGDQIKLAFAQAEKELKDIRQRTKVGMQTAKINGKQIGRAKGSSVTTKKKTETIKLITKHSIDFGGSLTDKEIIELAKVSKKSYYKYKKEIKLSINCIQWLQILKKILNWYYFY